MRLIQTLVLLIVSGALLSACVSTGSTQLMALPKKQDRVECQTPCDRPPAMDLPREVWELEVVRWGFECRALHQDCVEASK